MNKFALAAVAMAAAGAPAAAGTDPWSNLDLDRDFAKLAARVAPENSSIKVSAFLRSSYAMSDDVVASFSDGNSNGFLDAGESSSDLGGISIDDARIEINGTIGQFGLTVQIDGTDRTDTTAAFDHDNNAGTPDVTFDLFTDHGVYGQTSNVATVRMLDVYASFNLTSQFRVQVGQFRAPFLASSLREENELLFLDRSLLGTAWAGRDQGAQVSGDFPLGNNASWGFMVAALDGANADAEKLSYTGRIHITPIGPRAETEGALGAPGNPTFTIGASYMDDDSAATGDTIAFGLDGAFTFGQFAVAAERVEYNERHGLLVPAQFVSATGGTATGLQSLTGQSPFNFTVSYLIVSPSSTPVAELAVRYEDLDDDEESTVVTYGANYYFHEHAAKLQLNFSRGDSDEEARDVDVVQLGLTVSI